MLRVAEQYAASDTGRQRPANEDSLLARAPLYVVADGMGGAQAGEVASRIAVESFESGVSDATHPELALAALAQAANARIHELSRANAEQAGMGTTLTAVYVGEHEVAIAHVGDSRAYCLRDGELLRLTDDHSLVDELLRQGRLTPEEAVEHPQRSVITRALGPEGAVEVDTRSFQARDGDVYLLCSDGLTTMISEEEIAALLRAHPRLPEAGEALIAAANDAGGRDNITVVLARVEEFELGRARVADRDTGAIHDGSTTHDATVVGLPAVAPVQSPAQPLASPSPAPSPPPRRRPRSAPAGATAPRRRRRLRIPHAGALAFTLTVLGVLAAAGYLAFQNVYFIATNNRGLVTMYEGLPYKLPGGVQLYTSEYVSGVSASTFTPEQRHKLLSHTLRSETNAGALIRSIELEQVE
ncbi:MAG TPA: Stp1/IreP family PP2C-type Ser/Thr phosphatase [Solirubrobacteraceae bacterium]|jgi:serine/threonine protein phosphatase PrpC|nr:Stp1/IreP family PP2C-type Ser/Thr phosphatase [Solirubrobacteraceae bacterium]